MLALILLATLIIFFLLVWEARNFFHSLLQASMTLVTGEDHQHVSGLNVDPEVLLCLLFYQQIVYICCLCWLALFCQQD